MFMRNTAKQNARRILQLPDILQKSMDIQYGFYPIQTIEKVLTHSMKH